LYLLAANRTVIDQVNAFTEREDAFIDKYKTSPAGRTPHFAETDNYIWRGHKEILGKGKCPRNPQL
jgi:hypothetical protein